MQLCMSLLQFTIATYTDIGQDLLKLLVILFSTESAFCCLLVIIIHDNRCHFCGFKMLFV